MRLIVFNLYPYRQGSMNRLRRRVMAEMFVSLALVVSALAGVSHWMSSQLDEQQAYQDRLRDTQQKIAQRVSRVEAMKAELKKLREQVLALRSVQDKAMLASVMVSALENGFPETTEVGKITFQDGWLQVSGTTASITSFTAWVHQLEMRRGLFTQVEVVRLRQTGLDGPSVDGNRHEFDMKMHLSSPSSASPPAQELADATPNNR
ncbi:hypothetical protein NQT62_02510 [Limnobacter humi]|uniref:Fimbrial assembly protein n=1 Tax=Limnobacter humi TaxID=1778671 RepID=A0ABT1WE45_9BURK|nr:hypothetical protein [Limnobacter humi]MCQ8895311.1 hypothetical protein [Limnobacter humi]